MGVVQELLAAEDPSIRYKTRVHILGESARSKKARALREEIAKSPRAAALLSERKRNGEIPHPPYSKWRGTHWVLYALAELEYPPGDTSLLPLREQELRFLLSEQYAGWIRRVKGITRIHASIDANAVWSLHRLGLADERVDTLVARLVATQWQDGGWNCDVRATGNTSSFHESLLPLRALDLHARETGDRPAREAAARCAEIFLERKLYRRLRDGTLMDSRFMQLHFPRYWHYDVLGGLSAMREGDRLKDGRCTDALDWLEARQLPTGGWRADATYYRHTQREIPTGSSRCDWGKTGKTVRNDFVTVEALAVLTAAKRQVERKG